MRFTSSVVFARLSIKCQTYISESVFLYKFKLVLFEWLKIFSSCSHFVFASSLEFKIDVILCPCILGNRKKKNKRKLILVIFFIAVLIINFLFVYYVGLLRIVANYLICLTFISISCCFCEICSCFISFRLY